MVNKKASVAHSGVIHSLTKTADSYCRIYFSFGFYSFNATVTADYKTLSMEMHNPHGDKSGPFDCAAMHVNPTRIPSVVVYAGTLDWFSYAKGELTTPVVPYCDAEGVFFGLYHH